MAKKDPKDFPVEDKLKNLFQLQSTLSAIDEKRALRGELPLEVRDLEDEIAGLNTRIEKIKSEIDDFQRAITQKKADIQEAQVSLERYNKQLDSVANNREYDTLTKKSSSKLLRLSCARRRLMRRRQEFRSVKRTWQIMKPSLTTDRKPWKRNATS